MGVLASNEISLYGRRFRTRGPLREVMVSVFPGKVVIGDFTRDTEQLASSWIMSNYIGGLGKEKVNATSDAERFNFSTLETRYRDQVTLLPLAVDTGLVAGKANVLAGTDLNNQLYLAFDNTVHSRNDAAQVWALQRTLGGDATGAVTFRASDGVARAYFASGDALDFYNGTAWTTLAGAGMYQHLAIHDDKLYAIGSYGQLSYSTDGVTFTTTGQPRLSMEVGSATRLGTFFDTTGDPALYVATNQGLYIYDETAAKLRPTKLALPRYAHAGKGLADFQGSLFMSSGLDVYVYTTNTIAHMGLNRDYGLPAAYKGNILCLVPAQSWLFAVLDMESLVPSPKKPLYPAGGVFDAPTLSYTSGTGALFAWDGAGWHTVFAPAVMDKGSKWAGLSMADNKYRLWFGADSRAYYIDLSQGIYNPLRNPASKFSTSGYLTTGWFDGGWSELAKTAIKLTLRLRDIAPVPGLKQAVYPAGGAFDSPVMLSSSGLVTVEYGLDGNDTWNDLVTLPTSGLHSINLPTRANPEGAPFYSIRFRLRLTRGSDSTKTPVVDFVALKFLKSLDALFGWSFNVDASEDYNGYTPEEMAQELKRLAGVKVLGGFVAHDEDGNLVETMVKVTRLALDGFTGTDERRTIQVSVAEI